MGYVCVCVCVCVCVYVCVCGMFETNPKLENKPKTRKENIVVCAWNVRNMELRQEETKLH